MHIVNYLGSLVPEFENLSHVEGEMYLVSAEYVKPGSNDKFSDLKGLDLALNLPDDKPLILCSFLTQDNICSMGDLYCEKLQAILGKPKTAFIQLPFDPPFLLTAYYKALINKIGDPAAVILHNANEHSRTISKIRHDYSRYFDDKSDFGIEQTKNGIIKARETGLKGTDEEIMDKIMNNKYFPISSFFAGKSLPGIFCDVEGTLLINDKANRYLQSYLIAQSSTKPITLWTGGSIEEVSKKLRKEHIFWKILSKYDLVGAELEFAIDNEDQKVVENEYGVKIKTFYPVSLWM